MTPPRQAVIDIGTNTLLLLVTEPGPDGELVPVHDVCRFGRLGQGLDRSGALASEAIDRSLAIAREYREAMDRLSVGSVAVIGTQALREATNAAAFVGPAEQILGARIEVIGGQREAELVHRAVARSFAELAGGSFVVADVGGGSTEVIVVADGKVAAAESIAIGAVRLAERHLASDPPTAEQVRALFADIDGAIEAAIGPALPRGVPLIGTAGTATTLAAVELKLFDYDPARVQGLRVAPAVVERLLARFLEIPTAQRRAMRGMEPQRADVIPAGCAIYARLLHRLAAPELIVSDRGIRWGLAYELADAAAS